MNCKCGKKNTIYGRCKSCSNRERAGKYKWKSTQKIMNENNPMWKENPGMIALHAWVRRRKLKPQFCEKCREREPFDLANISGEYKRDINDFEWLCRKCHILSDGRMQNLKQFQAVSCGM